MNKPIKSIAKETALVFGSLICMLVIIVLTSIANAGMDFSKVFEPENVSNMIIAFAITIYGTIVAVPAGTVSTKQRINKDGSDGRYRQEYKEYQEVRKRIEPRRQLFNAWHTKQHLQECYSKKVNVLLDAGITQYDSILKLTVEQVSQLTTSQHFVIDGQDLFIKALTPVQIGICKRVLAGKVKVRKLPDFYFLYVDGKSKKSFYEQAFNESRSETGFLASRLAYKIFLGFVITCVFTGVVFMPLDPDADTSQMALKALLLSASRIFNALSSTFWGWLTGQEITYQQCYYLNGRTQFLKLFDADKSFTALTDEEQALQDIQEASKCLTTNQNQSSGHVWSDGSASDAELQSQSLPLSSDSLLAQK